MIDSLEWYKKAEKQTLETLPEFIREVRETFPSYDELPNTELKRGYKNGMIAGVLCMVAMKEAIATRYGWSCDQASVVRNVAFETFVRETYVDFERF